MEEKKKKNYVIPVIGALIAVVACVAYIVMKFASQQRLRLDVIFQNNY